MADAPQEKGHPHTIIVAAAGLRAADLARALRKFQSKQALVAKLFAKHIKLKEAVETVKKSRINIGVGTPQRIYDLLENGRPPHQPSSSGSLRANSYVDALSAAHVERVVVDASHIDQKKRGILDMKETQVPLVKLLTRGEMKDKYGTKYGNIELLFF